MRLGILFVNNIPIELAGTLARKVEESGFDSLYTGDTSSLYCPFSTMTLMANSTKKIRIGVGAINPYTRHPVMSALSLLSVDQFSGGRIEAAIGTGDLFFLPSIGISVTRPVRTVSEALQIMRLVCRGETFDFDGKIFKISHLKPAISYHRDLPLLIGCRGLQLVRLAARRADGILFDSIAAPAIPMIWREVYKAAASVNRDLQKNKFQVSSAISFAIHEDRQTAFQHAKKYVLWGAAHAADYSLEAAGVSKSTSKLIKDNMQDPDRAVQYVTRKILDTFAVAGNPEDVIRRLKEYKKAGLTEISLVLPVNSFTDQSLALMRDHVIPML
ncbi:MAG: LLM class flavin-dependent oxidoreductase [Candidatus Ranarchaeia archaeon]